MKKTMIIIAALFAGAAAFAQDAQTAAGEAAKALMEAQEQKAAVEKPRYWTNSLDFTLGFNQTGLWNWAAGGFPTITLAAGVDGKANFAKNLATWNNRLQLQYGFLWSADKKNLIQTNNDRIYLESKFGYNTAKDSKWSYTAGLDFRTQFTEGMDAYNQDAETGKWIGNPISNFFAPAYLNLALGIEWKPAAWFDLNIAPVTGGIVFCTDTRFREKYAMSLIGDTGERRPALFQFGAQVKANFATSINDKFKFDSQLVLFYDYLYDYKNPDVSKFPVRINWDNKISWQAAKFFRIGLDTWLIYDPLVMIGGKASKVQFKEFFSINFTYTIASKKK